MKKTFYILVTMMIIGCQDKFDEKVQKPFVVIDKELEHDNRNGNYLIEDNKGQTWWIVEERDAYKVGDTIR